MFAGESIQERHERYLLVKRQEKKFAKWAGIAGGLMMGFLGMIVLGAAGDTNAGLTILVVGLVLLGVFMYRQMAKNGVWTYYWTLEKTGDESKAWIAMLVLWWSLGTLLRIKYRRFEKKLKA